jgi:hypothetical protein
MTVRYAVAVVTLGEEGRGIEESLPAFRRRMAAVDELCASEGRDPATLRRCRFAGWANKPIFALVEATAEYVGRYVEAGATDFTFYLYDPAEPLFDVLVAQHRMATRDQLERAAEDVFAGYGPE